MVFLIRRDGLVLDFLPADDNHPVLRPESFVGRTVHELAPRTVADDVMRSLRRALQTGETQVHDCQLKVRGTMRNFEAHIVPSAKDEVVAIVRDLTRDIEAQNALRESEQRCRAISALVADWAYAIRFEPSGVVVREWATEAHTHTSGFTNDELDAAGG